MKTNFNFEEKSKINPFEVPDGYFEEFAQRMERQITPKSIPFMKRTRTYLYAAAMILAIFTIGTIFVNQYSGNNNTSENQPVMAYDETTNQMLLEEISEEAMIDYIIANAK